jgi:hypothetical protein
MVRLTRHCFRFCAARSDSTVSAFSARNSVLTRVACAAPAARALSGESSVHVMGTVTRPVMVRMKKGKNCP